MKLNLMTLAILLLTTSVVHAENPSAAALSDADKQAQYMQFAKQLWESLDRKHGEVKLSNGVATLDLGEKFYYLSPNDAEKVLVDVWGNPEGSGKHTLGMIFPEKSTPFDPAAWGVTIHYQEDGYVSDKDADDIDYDELLSQMKDDVQEANKQRKSMGYEDIELVGWAAKPYYDKATHTLHWAKEIKFGSEGENTLNYNIRLLGRKGVLVLNFVSGMNQKEEIDNTLGSVLALAKFDQGSRYEDFNPSMDKVAAYGIGALVAGKVLAKTGMLMAVLLFLKKFWILFAVGVAALFRKLFGGRRAA